MESASRDPTMGRTSWKRFGAILTPAIGAAAALVVMMANGAIAASFAVSGQQFKVRASSLEGDGFVQYGWVDQHADGSPQPVMISAMKNAEIVNLCQSVVTSLPIIGDLTVRITAGDGGTPVTAQNLFIDLSQLEARDAVFTDIEIGRDASTLDRGPEGAVGLQDLFSQQAGHVTLTDFQQTAWATNAGTFRLPNLHLGLSKGKNECF